MLLCVKESVCTNINKFTFEKGNTIFYTDKSRKVDLQYFSQVKPAVK